MDKPKFSIILPTRNRSFIIEKAIESVISQTFSSWELIIVDNDTSDDTRKKVEKYICKKIKYIRTGNLAMHDNWQTGVDKANGQYITVLLDKAKYAPYTLETISNQIDKNKDIPIFVWGYIFNDSLFKAESYVQTYEFGTLEVLQLFLNEEHDYINPILPKMIFSCCSRDILDNCKKLNQKLFQPINPDYTSMLAQLSYFEKLLYIETPLVNFNNKLSNGRAFRNKSLSDELAQDFINLTLNGDIDVLYKSGTGVDFDGQFNAILGDFIRLKQKYGGNLQKFDVNKLVIYKEAQNQLYEMDTQGINTDLEKLQLEKELAKKPEFIRKIIDKHYTTVMLRDNKVQYELSNEYFIEFLSYIVTSGKKVAFWGAGLVTRKIMRELKDLDLSNVYIVDSDENKHNQKLENIDVKPVDSLKKFPVDIIVVSTIKWHDDVVRQIKSMVVSSKILSPKLFSNFINMN